MLCVFAVVFALSIIDGASSAFIVMGGGCQDGGQSYVADQIWYHGGECARYGCLDANNPLTYKITCPDYPIPDCPYHLVSSPDAPFPNCCVRPVCT